MPQLKHCSIASALPLRHFSLMRVPRSLKNTLKVVYHHFVNILYYALLALLLIVAINAVSGAFLHSHFGYEPYGQNRIHAHLKPLTAQIKQVQTHSHQYVQQASLSLHANIDLKSIWNWNTKQLYVFITATYEEPMLDFSEKYSTHVRPLVMQHNVILYDQLMLSPEQSVINRKLFTKYLLVDFGKHLYGQNVTLEVGYDIMPIIGYMRLSKRPIRLGQTTFQMPLNTN